MHLNDRYFVYRRAERHFPEIHGRKIKSKHPLWSNIMNATQQGLKHHRKLINCQKYIYNELLKLLVVMQTALHWYCIKYKLYKYIHILIYIYISIFSADPVTKAHFHFYSWVISYFGNSTVKLTRLLCPDFKHTHLQYYFTA